jgi:calcium-dependent protein kinase
MVRKKNDFVEEFVIIDFGLSTKLERQDIIHKRCGTPGFLAPEIANPTDAKITSKCDIFSLGVTFFFM